jgi:type I restriction enzyme, S subunit
LASKKAKQGYKLVKNFFQKEIEIPQEWTYEKYGDIFQEIKDPVEFNDDEEYDLITVKRRNLGLVSRGILKGSDILTKNLFSVQEDDFLIARMQIVHGACGLVPKSLSHAKISGSYLRLKSTDKLNLKYLNLLSFTPFFYQQTFVSSVGSNIEKMNLNQTHWFNHQFPLPPKKEKNKIVSILNLVNDLVNKYDSIIETTTKIKIGLMQQLLTKGIGHKKFKKVKWYYGQEIEIPESSNVVTIGELLKKGIILEIQDGNHGELHPKNDDFTEKGTPFITAKFVHKNNKIDYDACNKLPLTFIKKLRIGFSEKNDLILVHKGDSIGKCAINTLEEICMLSPQTTYYRLSKKIDLIFLLCIFQNPYFQKQLNSFGIQSTRKYVGIKGQQIFKIILPPIHEQQKIASILFEVDKKIDDFKSRKTKLNSLKQGLMQKLLTGQIRV